MSNTPNVSRDSLDYSKFYETLVLQQGVPWLDSDFNEQVDLLALRRMMETNARYGSCLLPAYPGAGRGFEVTGIPATIANANVSAGYASAYGTIVQSSPDQIPSSFQYESVDNYMTDGFASSISGGDTVVSDDKKFEGWMSLVGCRIRFTSGAESGNEFEITSVPNENSLTCSGGVGSAAATDTYIIKPPALPSSVVSTTTKEFQLWVFWEWINENQDPNIVNPGVAMETCERRVLRWCIRAEDTPYAGTPDLWTFSLRVLPIADVTIEPADTTLYPVVYEDLFADPTLGWTKHMAQTFLFETTLSSGTSFLLPKYGDVDLKDPLYYYVGTDTTKASYRGFFEILDASDPEKLKPIVGSDGKPITIDGIWINSITEVTNPSGQASSEGFLTNADTDMQVRLDFTETADTDYTGDIICRCYYRAPFSTQTPDNLPESGVTRGIHAEKVQVPEYNSYLSVSGVHVYIPKSDMDTWVDQVGVQFRSRPATYPSSTALADDDWKILYSTGNYAGTDNSTVQMWWNRFGEFVLCQSCYPYTDSPNTQFRVEAASSSGILDASIDGWILDSAGHMCYVRAAKYSTTHGTVLDPLDKNDWDVWTQESQANHETYDGLHTWDINSLMDFHGASSFWSTLTALSTIVLNSTFSGIYDQRTPSTTRRLLYEWNGLSFGSIRIYFRGESSSQHFSSLELALNCEWKSDTSQWAFNREGLSDEATSAIVVKFYGSGIDFYGQHTGNVSGSRWDDGTNPSGTSWVTRYNAFTFTNSGNLGPKIHGRHQETRKVALAVDNVGSSSQAVSAADAVNYSSGYVDEAPDVGTTFTFSSDITVNWTNTPTVSHIDKYGFVVASSSDSISPGATAYWYGTVLIDCQPW